MSRVVVTGLGTVSPLGVGVKTAWAALLAGKSGIVSTDSLNDERYHKIPSKVIGKVPLGETSDGKWNPDTYFAKGEARRLAPFAQYALAATHEALNDANWHPTELEDQLNTGVIVGSGIGSISDTFDNAVALSNGGYRKVQPLFIPKMLPNMAAGAISIKYGLKGPNHAPSTACATGNHSIGDAYRFIKDGYANVIVAGAAEAPIHPLALSGFARAQSVATDFNDDPTKSCRPFDKHRSGFVLGEGSGILILEELEHAKSRDAKIYAEIVGYGLSGDGYHITAPSPDGLGAKRAMELATRGIDLNKIGYINAHATSTLIGDRIENNAIREIFQNNKDLLVSSTKGSHGHLLGAAGALEAIFSILAIKDSIAPPTLNLESPGGAEGDDINDFTLNLVGPKPQKSNIEYALSNSFGFGGVNTSLLFKKYDA
ncbi:3-oxoacyl-acyl-carrier-protein synthase [Wickerhamomyces ciferrii]|uniref:3-oxoacyl-[acyl-carrier-protein] synthase n=1 Tax=Wickerhamomyces ciferrii (strain ATCC 14091 / BCRC 22168 / CBS 111 / JCM 3599 / NBRC 0793 / NRRL Y-1031 F-60-10) TaxID=1206466 RepID=K0KAB1_WICCF|nr:3-oxoacyl-acyl-carrier-protein synthase [Wickerhamomyces ciferrii]CCH41885.1 3-oxoacyl-acyl-carrier-protein synthase [Wickerhamomyces ciferrii]